MQRSSRADLLDERADVKGGERRLLGRLDDHCVATAQSRRHLPHEHQQGEIPLQRQKKRGKKPSYKHISSHCKGKTALLLRKTTFKAQAVT